MPPGLSTHCRPAGTSLEEVGHRAAAGRAAPAASADQVRPTGRDGVAEVRERTARIVTGGHLHAARVVEAKVGVATAGGAGQPAGAQGEDLAGVEVDVDVRGVDGRAVGEAGAV